MFQRYGLRAMTMDDVCRELSMSKKTLYHYFTNKADLVDQAVRHVFGAHKVAMDQLSAEHENAIDRMIHRFAFLMKMMESHGPNMMFPLKKYYPKTIKTVKGHLNQTRKNVCSTKAKTAPLEACDTSQLHGKKV